MAEDIYEYFASQRSQQRLENLFVGLAVVGSLSSVVDFFQAIFIELAAELTTGRSRGC